MDICRIDGKLTGMARYPLPYGIEDLDPDVVRSPDDPDLIRCFVRGCRHFVLRPRRGQPGELCPDHGIFCHSSGTYSYADVRRNIIASPDLFAERIVGHPFKYESNRLGCERSEDALSWNVFRSLQEASCLAEAARILVGEDHAEEPDLYLWGIRVSDDSFEPWDLLIAARERFESNLPVQRPLTEPDIALHLPGRYLVLIEAKFTSPNTYYPLGPRKDDHSLTFDELLDIYQDSSLRFLDVEAARRRSRVHYQLWRNMIFAEWMAATADQTTTAYHVNLVRDGAEFAGAVEFRSLLRSNFKSRFVQKNWEDIYELLDNGHLPGLRDYMQTKTEGLRPAFSALRTETT